MRIICTAYLCVGNLINIFLFVGLGSYISLGQTNTCIISANTCSNVSFVNPSNTLCFDLILDVNKSINGNYKYTENFSMVNEKIYYLFLQDKLLYKSFDSGKSWELVYQLASLSLNNTSMKFFSEKIGLITGRSNFSSIVLKTEDGGVTWRSIFNDSRTTYSAPKFDMFNDKSYIFAFSDYIFSSNDNGINYSSYYLNLKGAIKDALIINSTIFIVLTNDNYFISTDGGLNWKNELSNLKNFQDALFVDNKIILYSGSGVSFSQDLGKTWKHTLSTQESFLPGQVVYFNKLEMLLGNSITVDGGCTHRAFGFNLGSYFQVGSNYYLLSNDFKLYKYSCTSLIRPYDAIFISKSINNLPINSQLFVINDNNRLSISNSDYWSIPLPNCWILDNRLNKPFWYSFVGNGESYKITIDSKNEGTQLALFSGKVNCLKKEDCSEYSQFSKNSMISINTKVGTEYYLVVDFPGYLSWDITIESIKSTPLTIELKPPSYNVLWGSNLINKDIYHFRIDSKKVSFVKVQIFSFNGKLCYSKNINLSVGMNNIEIYSKEFSNYSIIRLFIDEDIFINKVIRI